VSDEATTDVGELLIIGGMVAVMVLCFWVLR
jgi:hypothetical protein